MKRFFLSFCLFWATVAGFAAEAPPPDKLLPSDTLAVLTFPDYTKAQAIWKKAPYGQLWNDSSLKPFRDKLTAKFKSDLVEPLEREFGIRFTDYAGLAQGQVTFALMPASPSAKPDDDDPDFLLLIDTKDKRDVLKTNLANFRQKWTESGKQTRPEKIRDVEFTTFIFSSDEISKTIEKAFPKPTEGLQEIDPAEKKKEPKKVEWFVGQSESLLILGSAAKPIEKVLVRQSGGSVPSLAEQPGFASRYGAMFRDAPAYGWINLKSLFDLIRKSSSSEQKQSEGGLAMPSADKVMSVLGLTSLETLSFNVQDNSEGSFINVYLQSPESGRKGLARILAHQPKNSEPPSFVPADAVKFFRWRIDLQKAWTAVESMIGDISPQYASLVKTMLELAGKQDNPNFDFRKQIIGNLGDDIISYEKVPRNLTLEDLNSPPSLFLLSSPNAEDFAAAIKAIVAFLPQQGTRVKEREFLGRKVYTLAMTSYDREGKRRDRSLHYSASGGYVGFSYDVNMLEEYLRGSPSKALRETPGLTDAVQKVGGMQTGLFGYENQAESGRASFEILKKESGTLANLLSDSPLAGRLGMDRGDKTFKEWFDFSLLPAWDKISKYFSISVWAGTLNAEGLTVKVFSPVPPQLKAQ
jgi:hypothetical protein